MNILVSYWGGGGDLKANSKKIVRVFPRRTKATPVDELAFVGGPTFFVEAEEVHISVTFSFDIQEAERLASEWERVTNNIILGGPAIGEPGGDFKPGMYLRDGYVITSRGCPNRCPHCDVWRREGARIRELPITNGWNVLDDNLLACSETHVRSVFEMLKRQKRRAEFTGGLEAALLNDWHVGLLTDLRPNQMFFAYDTPDDHEPLVIAGKILTKDGFTRHHLRCYVLIGFGKDTMDKAEKRLRATWEAGFMPMAMLYRDPELDSEEKDSQWGPFQRQWAAPAIIRTHFKPI